MPIRTDVSEDPKGDPTKILPNQPDPTRRDDEVEPLLPRRSGTAAPPPPPGRAAQTPGDRRGVDKARDKDADRDGKKP